MSSVSTLIHPKINELQTINENECEVIVFGRGVGESILVRLSKSRWFAIDSCLDPITKKPVSLEYLNAINVDLENVENILISHWHDDHVRGISKLVDSCPNAKVIISEVMTTTELLTLMELQKSHKTMLEKITTGIEEMQAVLEFLKSKNAFPSFATVNKIIFNDGNDKMWTLSPSEKETYNGKIAFQKLIPNDKSPKKRIPLLQPNHCAVVSFFESGEISFALGSDLENSNDQDCGWDGILKNNQILNNKKLAFLKIAHHGSANAHNQQLWDNFLIDNISTALTPYNRSHIPKNEDILRITKKTINAHIAGKLSRKSDLPRRINTVDKMLNAATISRKALESKLGIVRVVLDCTTGKEKTVNYFGEARPLDDYKEQVS